MFGQALEKNLGAGSHGAPGLVVWQLLKNVVRSNKDNFGGMKNDRANNKGNGNNTETRT